MACICTYYSDIVIPNPRESTTQILQRHTAESAVVEMHMPCTYIDPAMLQEEKKDYVVTIYSTPSATSMQMH